MAETDTDDWGATERLAPADRLDAEALIVDVDGFEGPLDLLLTLSRTQKVDLRKISVLQLAEQYLNFVRQAAALRIELAADYLVMAAWLAFLKSRLLLPSEPGEAGPSAEDLAAHLAVDGVVVFAGFGGPGADAALGATQLDQMRRSLVAGHAPVEAVAAEIAV